jgi:peptidoglycan/LPS O-acetylase OafA/YrhL
MLIVWLAAQVPPVLAQIMGPDGLGFVDRSTIPLLVKVVQMNPFAAAGFRDWYSSGSAVLARRRSPAEPIQAAPVGRSTFASGARLPVAAAAVIRVSFPITHSRSLVLPLNALLIFGLAFGAGLLAKVLASRSMVLLGNASYALYLLHVPVVFLTYTVARAWFGAESPNTWPMFVAYVFVAIGVSILAFLLVEEPMRHRLRRCLTAWLGSGDPTGQSFQHRS